MEMTRRKLVQIMAGAASAICGGLYWAGQRASPRRIARAVGVGKYPGKVVPMGDITKQSKWSG
jgi:hypothetical protein